MTNIEKLELLEGVYKALDSHSQIAMALKWAIDGLSEEECNDCISRQALNNVLDKYQGREATNIPNIRDELRNLPSVQPTQKWIPVTEKISEDNQKVLCQDEEGNMIVGKYSRVFDSYIFVGRPWNVIAWQPLPEPYKGDNKNESKSDKTKIY